MNEISTTTLGDLIEFQRGYDLPKSEFNFGRIPVISSNGILGYHDEYKVTGPGITIGRSGTVGLPHFINENFFPHNTSLFVKDFKGNDPKYIFYLLKTLGLQSQKSGSGVPTMNRNHLHPLKVLAHLNIDEQKKIAAVLSALDAKIELNNRINAELESLAKTIYDYWFVQFDFPFDFAQGKPSADGKPYKSSGGEMVYVEEGNSDRAIPAGWEIGKLGDIGKNIRNGIKETDIDPEMSYIGLEHIPRRQIALDSWSKAVDLASSKFSFTSGNILFGKLRPYFHKVGVSFISGVCSTDILVLDSKQENYFGYFLMTVSSDDFIHYVTLATEGTRMPRTNWEHMKNYIIPIPDVEIVKKFNEVTKPLISQMKNNVLQNQQLTQLRDWLLPMLMNGQVSIK